jgi:hypothetical protein
MATTVRRPKTAPIPTICPFSIVANRRSLDTRIVVTRGSGSFSSAGIGLFRAASGLSAGAARVFRPLGVAGGETSGRGRAGFDSGFFAGSLTAGGFDSGFFAGSLTAGGFGSGFFAGSLAEGGVDGGRSTVAGGRAGAGELGFGVGGPAGLLSVAGAPRPGAISIARVAAAGTGGDGLDVGFDSGFFAGSLTAGGFDSGFFAGSLTAGGFDSGFFAGSLTAGGFDSGFFAATLSAGACALGAGGVDFALTTGVDFGFDSGVFGFDSGFFAATLTAGAGLEDAGVVSGARDSSAETAGNLPRMYHA